MIPAAHQSAAGTNRTNKHTKRGGIHGQSLDLPCDRIAEHRRNARHRADHRFQAGHRGDAGQSGSRRLADDQPDLRPASPQPAQPDQQGQCRAAAHGLDARPAGRLAGVHADRLSRRDVHERARRHRAGGQRHQRRSDLGIRARLSEGHQPAGVAAQESRHLRGHDLFRRAGRRSSSRSISRPARSAGRPRPIPAGSPRAVSWLPTARC